MKVFYSLTISYSDDGLDYSEMVGGFTRSVPLYYSLKSAKCVAKRFLRQRNVKSVSILEHELSTGSLVEKIS